MTPKGLEPPKSSARVHEDLRARDEDAGSATNSRAPSRTDAVASLATALEAAIRAGDLERALVLIDELRALGEPATGAGAVWRSCVHE